VNADRDLLAQIPGQLLAPDNYELPAPAGPGAPDVAHVVTDWNGRRVRLTFARMRSRKGRTSRWFWSPASAVFLENE
jgi:hypothetical protein